MKDDLRKYNIVGMHVAKQAIQKFAADSIRTRGPRRIVKEFEREIVRLRKKLISGRTRRKLGLSIERWEGSVPRT